MEQWAEWLRFYMHLKLDPPLLMQDDKVPASIIVKSRRDTLVFLTSSISGPLKATLDIF